MTATWTVTENARSSQYPSATLATHTSTLTSSDFINEISASSITLTAPIFTTKYNTSANSRNAIDTNMIFKAYAGEIELGEVYSNYGLGGTILAANTIKTITGTWRGGEAPIINLNDLFTENNFTERSIPITWKAQLNSSDNAYQDLINAYFACTGIKDSTRGITLVAWRKDAPTSLLNTGFTEGSITLNAPPIIASNDITYTYPAPQYQGLSTYTVSIASVSAQYGGNISSITLYLGEQSTTKTYTNTSTVTNETISLIPNVSKDIIPVIKVVDSRGQYTNFELDEIYVGYYSAPTVNFEVFRSDSIGKKDDEGHYGLATVDFTYISNVANLTTPIVTINETPITNYYAKTLDATIVSGKTYYTFNNNAYTAVSNPISANLGSYYEKASVTWYSNYNSQNGVSTQITNWSQIGSNNQATAYCLINACLNEATSYQIGITETDSQGTSSGTITQNLSTAFYTIDIQAGGKELVFGGPAKDNISNFNNKDYSNSGLFKCNMGTAFNDMSSSEITNFIEDLDISGSELETTQADWVVESGTDGIWTWRKWRSGIAECWGETGTISLTNYSTPLNGNGYGYTTTVTFPTDLFVATPIVTYSAYIGSGFALTGTQTGNRSNTSVGLYAVSASGGTKDTNWFVSAKGRWK